MTYFLFLYTIVLTLLFGVSGFGYLALYSRNKLRRDLWVAIMFLFFTCDNLIYSMTEILPGFLDFYSRVLAVAPFPSNLVVIGMIFSYRMVIAYEFDSLPSKREKTLHLICLIMLLLFTAFSGQSWGRYAFFILNQSLVAATIVIGFYGLLHHQKEMSHRNFNLWLFILLITAVTHGLGIIERAQTLHLPQMQPYRAVGFEVFGLICAAISLYYLFMYLGHKPRTISDNELFSLFVSHYGLTPREAELIPCLLSGAPNADICEKMFISLSTVKVHTHNIYQKLGIERRSQLSVKYSEFMALHKTL